MKGKSKNKNVKKDNTKPCIVLTNEPRLSLLFNQMQFSGGLCRTSRVSIQSKCI